MLRAARELSVRACLSSVSVSFQPFTPFVWKLSLTCLHLICRRNGIRVWVVLKVVLRGLWPDSRDAEMAALVKRQGVHANIPARDELLWWVLFEGAGGTWHYLDNERLGVLSVGTS